MKYVLTLLLMLIPVLGDECPAKLLAITTKNMKKYLGSIYPKVGKFKVDCSYNHDLNIFNLEHRVIASTTYKDKKLSLDLKTHSSMFDLFNFTDFNGSICHSKMRDLKDKKDRKYIKKAFMNNYSKNLVNKKMKRYERKGQVCYRADVESVKKMKRALL